MASTTLHRLQTARTVSVDSVQVSNASRWQLVPRERGGKVGTVAASRRVVHHLVISSAANERTKAKSAF